MIFSVSEFQGNLTFSHILRLRVHEGLLCQVRSTRQQSKMKCLLLLMRFKWHWGLSLQLSNYSVFHYLSVFIKDKMQWGGGSSEPQIIQ